jgi:DNA helicase II / ATP-dependent DNA helicase PcrA
MDPFTEAYTKLNTEQKKAVDTIEGPVIVIAGPGTGKTQILTLRIANILKKTDTAPEQILAITFTEAGVTAMRKRLVSLIGKEGYRVRINTFHGYCEEVIKRFPEFFPRIIGSHAITEVDQVTLIEEIIQSGNWNILRPWGDPFLYVRDIVSAISELKREGYTPQSYASLIQKEKEEIESKDDLYYDKGVHKGKMKGQYTDQFRLIEKNAELAEVYKQYEMLLTEHKAYDFNDMILEVLHAMESDESLTLLLQEESQYLLIDEHQDTNNAQNRIIELLASFYENPNLFVVGDEKQAIFRFQGASLENFYYFTKKYPSAVSIPLVNNYRSASTILNQADTLIPGVKPLISAREVSGKPIEVITLKDEHEEHDLIAARIKELINNNVPAHEIAVLYRNNKEALGIAQALSTQGISYVIESDQDILKDPDVAVLVTILRAVHHYGNTEDLVSYLHLPVLGLHPLDIYRLISTASQKRIYSVIDLLVRDEFRKEIKPYDDEALKKAAKILETLHTYARTESALFVAEQAFRESELLEIILKSPDWNKRLEHINDFFDFLSNLERREDRIDLSSFFKTLHTIKTHGLLIKMKRSETKDAVRLMTAHKSKGLEFSYVFILHMIQGVWGGKRIVERLKLLPSIYGGSEGDAESDERRLLYVALTRAKEHVVITLHQARFDGKEVLPSPFLDELKQDLKIEENLVGTIPRTYTAVIQNDTSIPAETTDFLLELFSKKAFSVSALNNYLECPWKYFYVNLLCLPSTPNIKMCFGQAIHKSIEQFFHRRKDEGATSEYLISTFEQEVHRLPVSAKDELELLEKGKKALLGWYKEHEHDQSWNLPARSEYMMRSVFFDEVELIGVFDRVEYLSDNLVHIVDYKTGKPKTRKQIEIKSDGVDGNYYRQLTFYKLLIESFQEGRFSLDSAELQFIEPDEKGKYHSESFVIEDEEVNELKDTLYRVFGEIRSLSFWNNHCSEKDCEYCALKRLIHPS